MNGLSLAEFELPSHQRKAIPKTCIANDTITDEALALFGGLASAASATWQAIGSGPYQRFTFALPFRSPKHPELTRPNQQSWLVAMLNIFSRYRAEILTAEALLTYATAFDMRAPGSGIILCDPDLENYGDKNAAHIGRLLAQVLNQSQAHSSATLKAVQRTLIADDNAARFGLHISYAGWHSQQPELIELLLTKLKHTNDGATRRAIIRPASEASSTDFLKLLQVIYKHKLWQAPDVAEELRNWFWFGELQLLPGSLDEILGKVIQALAQMHAGEPPQLKSDDDKLVWAWTLMTHEVDEAVPILTELMQVTLPLARRRGVALAGIARHPSVLASIWQGLDRPDLNEVVIILSACNYLVNHLSDGDKNRLVEKVGEVCQRGYKQRRKYPALFGGQHNRFFSAVTSLLRALWTNQSLAMFGSVVKDRDFRLGSFLGQGYIAPDDFSIEAIIGQIDYAHSFAAQDLWASPLKAQHWAALLLKNHPPDEDVPTMYAQAMQGRVTQQIFDEVVQILEAAPQPAAADTAQKLASAAARLKPYPN